MSIKRPSSPPPPAPPPAFFVLGRALARLAAADEDRRVLRPEGQDDRR